MPRKKRKPNEARLNKHVDLSMPLPELAEDDLYNLLATLDNPLVLILDGI